MFWHNSYVINTEKGRQAGVVALAIHNLVTRSGRFKHKLNLKVKETRPPAPTRAPACVLFPVSPAQAAPGIHLLLQAFADPRSALPFPALWLPLDMPSFLKFSLGLCQLVNSHSSLKTQLKHNTSRKALVALPGGIWPPCPKHHSLWCIYTSPLPSLRTA